MLRALEAQAPPKQNATDTINVLSGRLVDATLLEDRRGAILGLRSFAKEYPATVASGSLRALISTLSKDVDDVDTGKVVLETLLNLFHPDEDSPEASPDIALWLADEFSVRQDNITVLLNLLELNDFYARLYSLQLLTAVSEARLERAQECILAAPLGTSRLVGILDDPREAIRSAGLLFLTEITQGSAELQKLVAFEGAFERLFNLINAEGAIGHGGILVQDCLSLLANLVDFNASNQSLFRESGHVPRLCELVSGMDDPEEGDEDAALGPDPNKEKNLWGLLRVIRLFLSPGSKGTQPNQWAFVKTSKNGKPGLLHLVLGIGFNNTMGEPIRAEAFRTCADMIRGNSDIQGRFGGEKVAIPTTAPQENGVKVTEAKQPAVVKHYLIDALLDVVFTSAPTSMFDVRFAACQCLAAWYEGHHEIKLKFIDWAMDGYSKGHEYGLSVILNILMAGPREIGSGDPYQLWFAALLVFRAIFEQSDARRKLMQLIEGDESKGEEVITLVQKLTGHLIESVTSGEDNRVSVGYLMVLCGCLFEDADAVNDLLSEGSNVSALLQAILKKEATRDMVQGLCTYLLGILYEFSTKDSPIPRRKLQPLLLSGLGRDVYIQKLNGLRQHPILREFEITPQDLSSADETGLPAVYFDASFLDFMKDNFSRILRAIDKDPGIEVVRPVEGIDRDLVDNLRNQISDKTEALQKSEAEHLTLNSKIEQLKAEVRSADDRHQNERSTMKKINESLHRDHDNDMEKLRVDFDRIKKDLHATHATEIDKLNKQQRQARDEATREAQQAANKHKAELGQFEKRTAELESSLKQTQEKLDSLSKEQSSLKETVSQRDSQIKSLKDDKKLLEESIDLNTVNVRRLESQIQEHERRVQELKDKEASLRREADTKEEARASAQTELDDLLMVLGDLEDKRTRDKTKLKELGADISDDDEDEDANDGDDDDDESEEDEDEDEEADDEEAEDQSKKSDAGKAQHSQANGTAKDSVDLKNDIHASKHASKQKAKATDKKEETQEDKGDTTERNGTEKGRKDSTVSKADVASVASSKASKNKNKSKKGGKTK